MNYKQLPVTIEAVKFEDTVDCLQELAEMGVDPVRVRYGGVPCLILAHGVHIAHVPVGDYIVKHISGAFYPQEKSEFEKFYEPAPPERVQTMLKNELITQKCTYITHEDKYRFNAPHHFEVHRTEDDKLVGKVDFQEGPVKENGVNGMANEDLIAMVLTRLQGFQSSTHSCRENAMAITKLEEALMWLRKRTLDREARDVEGTSKI